MSIDTRVFRSIDWWQWAVVSALLVAHFLGAAFAFPTALALCVVMALGLWAHLGLGPYAVQIRLGHLLFMLPGLLPETAPLLAIPLAGSIARIAVGYCPVGRALSLMPWNRVLRLMRGDVARILFTKPERGGIVRLGSTVGAPHLVTCMDRDVSPAHRRRQHVTAGVGL